jgi:flavodoxin
MKTTIYFYTGTGNSLWTVKILSEILGDTKIIPITLAGKGLIHSDSENIGLIFPVHIWGIPVRVIDFLNRLETDYAKYYFAVAVNAGQVAATLIQLKMLLQKKSINLSAGFSICMPSNYIPLGGAIAQGKQQKKFNEALDKIRRIAASIRAKEEKAPEKGPPGRIFSFQRFTAYLLLKFRKWINRFLLMKNAQAAVSAKKFAPHKIY